MTNENSIDLENNYQLKSGKIITDESISRKMQLIAKVHPEQPQADSSGYSWDESGMAELFSECYKDDTRFCPEAKCWYTYDKGAWRRDVGGLLVAEKIKEFARLMGLYCWEITDEDLRKRYLKFVALMGDRRFRERLQKDASSVYPISATTFDSNPYLINCLNGTYDLKNMVFREHQWQDFLTMQTNFDYTMQEHIKCDRWLEFVDEVTCGDKDKANFLQRALGYSMLGTSNEECMFILYGKTTRNGKSTMLETIHHLLGDYATVSPVSVICKADYSKNADAPSPTIANLKGKRFVTMAESDEYGKFDEQAIKQLTGGEEICARNLHESMMTFLPQFTLWLSCNDLPSVRDKSLFASNRIKVIEFTRHFSEAEQDPTLKEHFRSAEAMKGIFAWLVEGYFLYKRFGLKMSDSMRSVIKKYERDNDLVLQFLEEQTTQEPINSNGGIRAKNLYDAYKIWCKSNGYFTMSAKKFSSNMDFHGEKHSGRVVRDGYPFYKDLYLREL